MSDLRRDLLNPTLLQLLELFTLDQTYVRGEGSYLWNEHGDKILDFISQYGSVPFGYNPPFVWEAIDAVKQDMIPAMVQPSLPHKALELANLLALYSPGDLCYSTFCQSGAEAVETAIKLARSSCHKPIIVSMDNSFHGKTLGALSATGREAYQGPFFTPVPGFVKVPFNHFTALKNLLETQKDEIAGVIVEPIQGEGGIIPAHPGYLKKIQDLCRSLGIIFIVDEIQTGLGRTGALFACEDEGIEPDILLLAKSLGGGMVPLGVCLSSPAVWNDEFGALHSSTFANNNLTCTVGLAVMETLLARDREIIREVKAKGEYLLARTRQIQDRYPEVIKDVRGRGLMVGLEFHDFDDCGSYDMAYIYEQGAFTALLAGYLLSVHNIRVVPFLNNPMTVRLQPNLLITYDEINRVIQALELICNILDKKDFAQLYRYLIGDFSVPLNINDYRPMTRKNRGSVLHHGEKPEKKFAFIIHYPSPEDVVLNNPSFERYSQEELYRFLQWQSGSPDPSMVCHMPAIRSKNGALAEGWLIGVPFGGREIMSMPRKETVAMIARAVDLGRSLGAEIVGLGALTSVVTGGGRLVVGRDVAITSGNSFTTLMAIEALYSGAEKMHLDFAYSRGAVVGATGSIGRACALLMSDKMKHIVLLGNPERANSSKLRLNSLVREIIRRAYQRLEMGSREGMSAWLHEALTALSRKQTSIASTYSQQLVGGEEMDINQLALISKYIGFACPLEISLNLAATLPRCQMIVAASNSPEYLIHSEHLAPGTVVCDVARPADVHPEVITFRDDILILEGGLVCYPDKISFGPNLGYRDGVNLACLSETVLLALEGDFRDYSIGNRLSLDVVDYLKQLGDKHGFGLAGLKMGNHEISDDKIEEIYKNSRQTVMVENM